jgi:formylglycine-generating enzyme required for sulfatase activity
MKRLMFYFLIAGILASCSNSGSGELVGSRKKSAPFYQPTPYGMVFVPQGSFVMGAGDEDVARSYINQPKTVSVSAFYMDQTEITNNEYRQFVNWVRDSIARMILGEVRPEDYLIEENPKTGEVYDPPYLNWETKIDWNSEDQDIRDALEEMYYPEHERFFRKKEIDTRKLMYTYSWIDYHEAAKKDMSQPGDYHNAGLQNRPQGLKDRSVYVYNETINVYPDTLCWIADYAYSFNDPLTEKYFWHPAYDNYPVVGVNWRQARAFSVWRTNYIIVKEKAKREILFFQNSDYLLKQNGNGLQEVAIS